MECTICTTAIEVGTLDASLECHHCDGVFCLKCTGLKGDLSSHQPIKVINSKSIKGLTWMCDKCLEWTKGNRIQAESILNKVSEQKKLIDQLMEEGKNR